ncbi:MAG: TRAP transporter substrate-binding protein DctP [Spirochaetia bacterium]|nr:TRAP transporter substrate-binding protein DctP [Spirochaetia bacterium]
MKKIVCVIFLLFFCFGCAFAGTVIKLGSVAPVGSLWDIKCKEIASEWKRISNGEVELKLYMGGTVGDEDNMIRAMKMGGLNAGAMTAQGIKGISADSFALCLPFVVKDDDEFSYVFDKMKGTFEKKMEEQGFITLGWAMTGWVKFFSRDPIVSPDDLKKQKIAIDTDGRVSKIWTDLGFHAIPLAFNDILAGLYSGMADVTYVTPLAASSMGLTAMAPNMCDISIAPVYCAFVIEKRAWNRVPEKYRNELKKRTSEIAAGLYDIIKVDESRAVEIMKKDALIINDVPADVQAEWMQIGTAGSDVFSRELISKEVYDEMISYVNEYRKK